MDPESPVEVDVSLEDAPAATWGAATFLNVLLAVSVCVCATYFLTVWYHRRQWERAMSKKELSIDELKMFNGSYGAPIYISLAGIIFDVMKGIEFYQSGRSYHVYAGRESGRALGHMSLGKPIHAVHLDHPLVDDMTAKQKKVLADWIDKFYKKYPVVGTLKERSLPECAEWMPALDPRTDSE